MDSFHRHPFFIPPPASSAAHLRARASGGEGRRERSERRGGGCFHGEGPPPWPPLRAQPMRSIGVLSSKNGGRRPPMLPSPPLRGGRDKTSDRRSASP